MHESADTLLDLPTEILQVIFKKLNNIDVLYSLCGFDDQRLDAVLWTKHSRSLSILC